MCDQFHDGTGFLTHHLALTNSFEVGCPGSLLSVSLSLSITHHCHTNTQSHPTTLLLPPQHPHRYHLTHSLHLNAATGCYAHSGSICHSALLGLHNRGAIHHVSAGALTSYDTACTADTARRPVVQLISATPTVVLFHETSDQLKKNFCIPICNLYFLLLQQPASLALPPDLHLPCVLR
jgi:hypothetical protein